MFELSYLELVMLFLSVFTFLTSIILLCWIMFHGGYQACIGYGDNEYHSGHYDFRSQHSPRPAFTYHLHTPEMFEYSRASKPRSSVERQTVLSTDGSSASENTKDRILNSHPQFWDNVAETGDQRSVMSYGSMVDLQDTNVGLKTDASKFVGYGPQSAPTPEAFSYATINLQFKSLDEGKILNELITVQTQLINFTVREIFLELRCHILPQDPQERKDFLKIIYPTERKSSKGFLETIMKSNEDPDTLPTSIYRYEKLPLSRMRKSVRIDKKLLFRCKTEDMAKTNKKPEVLARCYYKRDGRRVYIGRGVVEHENVQFGSRRMNGFSTEDGGGKREEVLNISDLRLKFTHEPEVTTGKALLTLTYLPTAAKLNLDIKEFQLTLTEGQPITQYTDLFWKVNLHKSTQRRSKRKLTTVANKDNQALWSSDQVITFDKLTPDVLFASFIIFKLIGQIKGEEETKADEQKDSGKKEAGKKSDFEETVIGEFYLGCQVPDDACREHWFNVMRNPRQSFQKWHDVI